MSAPAANAFSPEPVMMTTRISSAFSRPKSAVASSPSNCPFSALSTFGRLRVMMPIGPSCSTCIVSNALGIVVEALSALATVASGKHHALEQRRCGHRRILELVEHDLRDIIRRVQTDEVEEFEWPHRVAASELHACVDVFFGREPAFEAADRIQKVRDKEPVDDKSGRVLRKDRVFAELLGKGEERIHHILRRGNGFYHLDQFHDGNGVEEMKPGHAVRPLRFRGELDDAETRGVSTDNSFGSEHLVEGLEELGLDLDVLDDGLDHEVAAA